MHKRHKTFGLNARVFYQCDFPSSVFLILFFHFALFAAILIYQFKMGSFRTIINVSLFDPVGPQ